MPFPLTNAEHEAIKFRIDFQEEIIVAAAVEHESGIISMPRPARHGDIINWLCKNVVSHGRNYNCGFVTNRGRFVERKEATQIVRAAKQGDCRIGPMNPYDLLFSEDLWNDT